MLELLVLLIIPVVIGTVVRYRATYYPSVKSVSHENLNTKSSTTDTAASQIIINAVDVDCSKTELAGPLSELENTETDYLPSSVALPEDRPTFMRVLWKVWKNDQFEGIYKGFVPGLIFPLLFCRFYVTPAAVTLYMNRYTAVPYNLVYIVYLVLTYRIIVSPHKIKLAEPKSILRLIFSDYERTHPFRFFQYCGLIVPFIAQYIFGVYVYWPLRNSIPDLDIPFDYPSGEHWYKYLNRPLWDRCGWIMLYWTMPFISTLLFSPVDVIITRLAIQPVQGKPSKETVTDRDVEKLSNEIARMPFNLPLSNEQCTYLGFMDCFQRIVKEEGWGVLYRAWWFTLPGFWVEWLR